MKNVFIPLDTAVRNGWISIEASDDEAIAHYTVRAERIKRTPSASGWQDILARAFLIADRARKLKLIAEFSDDLNRE